MHLKQRGPEISVLFGQKREKNYKKKTEFIQINRNALQSHLRVFNFKHRDLKMSLNFDEILSILAKRNPYLNFIRR